MTPEEITQAGDHEFLNWMVPMGVLGDRPAPIVSGRGVLSLEVGQMLNPGFGQDQ